MPTVTTTAGSASALTARAMRMARWVSATPAAVRSVPAVKGMAVQIGATISGCVSWNWPRARSSDWRIMKLRTVVIGSGSPASRGGTWFERAAPIATHIPGAVPAMYAVMARSVAVRQRIGTVAVTAVGMFAGGGGFGITPMTMMSLEVVVGGMSQRPRVVDGQVEVRDVLDLSLAIDHTVVDGAPATRFGAELRELVEGATAISPSNRPAT